MVRIPLFLVVEGWGIGEGLYCCTLHACAQVLAIQLFCFVCSLPLLPVTTEKIPSLPVFSRGVLGTIMKKNANQFPHKWRCPSLFPAGPFLIEERILHSNLVSGATVPESSQFSGMFDSHTLVTGFSYSFWSRRSHKFLSERETRLPHSSIPSFQSLSSDSSLLG